MASDRYKQSGDPVPVGADGKDWKGRQPGDRFEFSEDDDWVITEENAGDDSYQPSLRPKRSS